MAGNPSKNDITAVFKRLRSIPTNKQCFDCGAKNPTWSSVTYGVFICIDCSAVHRGLGVHLSFVRSTNLDTTYSWVQLRSMQLGGNAAASSYFAQHGISGHQIDAQQKYNSRAAALYREKLHNSAIQAMKTHGTKLWIDESTDPASRTDLDGKEESFDFFEEHSSLEPKQPKVLDAPEESLFSNNVLNNNNDDIFGKTQPKSESSSIPDNSRSSLGAKKISGVLGARRIGGGLGARKAGGLGAQKASVNFDELEREAKMQEELKAQMEANQKLQVAQTKEQKEKQIASMRLAYQELSEQQKKKEEQFRTLDPKRAEQVERLGMGFVSGHGVSHSAMSDMTIISQQEEPEKASKKKSTFFDSSDGEFEIVNSLKSLGFGGPPKYCDSPFPKTNKNGDWEASDEWTLGQKTESSGDNWLDEFVEKSAARKNSAATPASAKTTSAAAIATRLPKSATMDSMTATSKVASEEAVKKFANAKSISSEQFFGGDHSNDFETRANLSRFEGSNSISSSDYFGDGQNAGSSTGSLSSHTPNLYEIKEGLRDGATKVASRLSSIASGVMSSLQKGYNRKQ
ncbi:ADP-ribosylation factor GTPase-activating protein 2 [Galendromus occidentalis]|uniref:ADP-ribosylation factor GTPase-activating protein 2 n=1 Tax=Galendromus occidentalis TaxID=34638 RepID=A0AAJ6VXN9_9ACAR|nr:ADP-ribosylation factor GTPase-activating protein 2 [Galendromus occidentalis]